MKARQAAETGVVDNKAFGGLFPPKDPTQKQYYGAMKAFAEGGATGETMSFPPTLSGFHKASIHLYVTLLGLGESTGPDKEIIVRHRKKKDEGAPAKVCDLPTSPSFVGPRSPSMSSCPPAKKAGRATQGRGQPHRRRRCRRRRGRDRNGL